MCLGLSCDPLKLGTMEESLFLFVQNTNGFTWILIPQRVDAAHQPGNHTTGSSLAGFNTSAKAASCLDYSVKGVVCFGTGIMKLGTRLFRAVGETPTQGLCFFLPQARLYSFGISLVLGNKTENFCSTFALNVS